LKVKSEIFSDLEKKRFEVEDEETREVEVQKADEQIRQELN
jgi:hypothetical protein